jgi:exopolyphosphatase / guanosine-5'-triphosphate,3'-diphosphate pyrophosphatase
LREGLILRKLDSEADGTALVETAVRDASHVGDKRGAGDSR